MHIVETFFLVTAFFFFEAREAIALRENQALKRVARYHGQRENISHLIERMD